jgi:hypothetical protein
MSVEVKVPPGWATAAGEALKEGATTGGKVVVIGGAATAAATGVGRRLSFFGAKSGVYVFSKEIISSYCFA